MASMAEHDTTPLIVCADDDADIRELVTFVLGSSGYRVVFAADGTEAFRLAESWRPALMILDVSMPGLDGLELTRRLRAGEGTSEIPVVLLTARTQEADVQRGYDAGADAYITKPFSLDELSREVQRLLAEEGSTK
jgi:two-component system, OmpR family, response regulator MtrA